MKIILITERLTVREFNLNDAPFILELLNTRGWIENIGDRNIHSLQDAENYLANKLMKAYTDTGFGFWMVEETRTGVSLGMAGLVKRNELEHVDIGFAFLPIYQNLGYAYESSLAILKFALNELSLKNLAGITLPQNESSIRLLKKLGLNHVKNYIAPDTQEELMLFELKVE